MDKDAKNFILNSLSGLLTGVVVIYLDKYGLTTLSYIVFGLYLLLIIAICIKEFTPHKNTGKAINQQLQEEPDNEKSNGINQTQEEVMLKQIVLHILRLRGANEPASPKRIAELMGQDTGIVFAHMWKLHNDQYMTFQTGGAVPTVDTDFFLSPKAYDIVNLESA